MNRNVAQLELEQIEAAGKSANAEERLEEYRLLHRRLQRVAQPTGTETWKVAAAETFVDRLWQTVSESIPPGISPPMIERLRGAIFGGPLAVQKLIDELDVEIKLAEAPRAVLESLQTRARCLRLRQECLEHLRKIFTAERAQP